MDAEENGEASFTMKELTDAELEADLILGGDDGKDCTYPKGYMARQAIFTCLTCTPEGNAGCCTACSMTCHDGHQVLELWTKRHFRCDCGNSKYGGAECKFFRDKDRENEENAYNQNFAGKYCICHRPYPDSDGEEDVGEMVQCCICEDWFHEAHMGLAPDEEVPKDDENDFLFEALICRGCIQRCNFLSHYPELFVAPTVSSNTPEALQAGAGADGLSGLVIGPVNGQEKNVSVPVQDNEPLEQRAATTSHPVGALKGNLGSVGTVDSVCKERNAGCLLNVHQNDSCKTPLSADKSLFLGKSWRTQLCMCSDCLELYKSRKVEFLFQQGDSLQEYEEVASQKRAETLALEEGAQRAFLDKLGHVQQIELLHGINDMASQLVSFLTPIAEAGRSITSDDIYDCFEQLKKKRKQSHDRVV